MSSKKSAEGLTLLGIVGVVVKTLIAAIGLLVIAVVAIEFFFLSGRGQKKPSIKETTITNGERNVKAWLSENEPSSKWDYSLSQIRIDNYGTSAAEGKFTRGAETVDFVYVEKMPNKPSELKTDYAIFVSSLPSWQEKEILRKLCADCPPAHEDIGLSMAREIYISVNEDHGNLTSVKKIKRKLFPAWIDCTLIDQQVPSAGVSDNKKAKGSAELRRRELNTYAKSSWRENYTVEIMLTEINPSECLKQLLDWVQDEEIAAAVIRGKDGTDCLTIVKSYILQTTDGAGKIWGKHWSVFRGDDPETVTSAADVRHFDRSNRQIEARVDEAGVCRAYFSESGKEVQDFDYWNEE